MSRRPAGKGKGKGKAKRRTGPGNTASAQGRSSGRAAHTGGGGAGFERLDLGLAAALVAIAWLHRVFFLMSNRDREWPFTIFYEGDAQTFFLWARAMLAGRLYDEGIPFHPPGFAGFLAGLHTLLGAGGDGAQVPHFTVKVVLALLSSLAVGLLYLLVRPYLGRATAGLAALLLTYHFGHYVISIAPVGEGIYLSLLLTALLLWSRGLEHAGTAPGARPGRPLVAGFALGGLGGLLALLRFESVLILGLLGAVGLGSLLASRRADAERSPLQIAVLPWLLVAVGWVTVVAPWTLRNHTQLSAFNARMGQSLAEPLPTFVPVTIYGPLNLALANQAGADGRFSPQALTGMTGGSSLDLTLPTHLDFLLHGDAMAWRWIRQNPGDFARLVLKKWRLSADVFTLGFSQWNLPGGLTGVRRQVDLFVPDAGGGWWLWPLLVLVGGIMAWRRGGGERRWALIVLLLTGCWLVVVGLFFGYVRQGLLYLPFWLTLAAVPLTALGRRIPFAPSARRPVLAAVVLLLLIVAGWGSRADRNYRASASSTVDGHHLNPDDEIRLELITEP